MAWLVDHNRADRLHELFTPDATLVLGAREMSGKEAIAAWGAQRATATRTSRHLMANHRFAAVTDAGASADVVTGSVLTWVITEEASTEDGAKRGPTIVTGEYHDTYSRGPEGWRFDSRRFEPLHRGRLQPM